MTAKLESEKFLSFIFEKYSYQNRFLSPRDEIFNCISKAIREVRLKIKSESIEEMKEYYENVIRELKKKAHYQIEIFEKDIKNMPEKYKNHYISILNRLKSDFQYTQRADSRP